MLKNLLALVLTCICCTGCMTTPALSEQQRPSTWAQPLDAQHNFYQVSPMLFRSAQAQQQKVLIHCYHGADRTGASVAMYRIMFEHWPVEQALAEMKYGGFGFHPIWVNIDALFRPENIKWIRQQLSNPSD